MEKSPFTKMHRLLITMLREQREAASLTQAEVAERLGVSQSFVSKWERGDRRIDVVQLREWCQITGDTLPKFVSRLETRLAKK